MKKTRITLTGEEKKAWKKDFGIMYLWVFLLSGPLGFIGALIARRHDKKIIKELCHKEQLLPISKPETKSKPAKKTNKKVSKKTSNKKAKEA